MMHPDDFFCVGALRMPQSNTRRISPFRRMIQCNQGRLYIAANCHHISDEMKKLASLSEAEFKCMLRRSSTVFEALAETHLHGTTNNGTRNVSVES
jgi:hypothetical protein